MPRSERLLKRNLPTLTAVNRLPVEIVRYIIRLATGVHVAFDTGSEFVLEEDRVQTRRLILASLRTKLAVTLVSKSFAILTEEFLYEIVLVTRYRSDAWLERLANLLHDRRNNILTPRGTRVRRLELHFHLSIKTQWTQSWDTLWGLLPACPNLEALYFTPQDHYLDDTSTVRHDHALLCLQEREGQAYFDDDKCFETFEGFPLAIVKNCGRTLRRLHLGSRLLFPTYDVRVMLSCLPTIEVVYIGSTCTPQWTEPRLISDHLATRLRDLLASAFRRQNPSSVHGHEFNSNLPPEDRMKALHTLLLPSLPVGRDCQHLPALGHVALNKYSFLATRSCL